MNFTPKQALLGIACCVASTVALSHAATAQQPAPQPQNAPETIDSFAPAAPAQPRRLVDSVAESSDPSISKPTVAEMRQARAAYRAQQRLDRMERNLWSGYEPLRPNWNSIPMMSSRYPDRGVIVVPLYYYP